MAVQPADGAVACAGKQISKHAVAPQIGLATDDGHEGIAGMRLQDSDGRAYAADVRGAVKGGAGFVMRDGRAQCGKQTAHGLKFCLHFSGCHGACGTGDAEAVERTSARKLGGGRQA